jgi:hypothetical protein
MKLKNYQKLCVKISYFACEDTIRTSGEEYGTSWDQEMWGDGSSF